MSADDTLALALSEWQRKHGIADGDPMIAVLDLVRLAVLHPPKKDAAASLPPTFEEFRATILELEREEDDISLHRRVLHGRIDILRAERERRRRGGLHVEPTDLGPILGGSSR